MQGILHFFDGRGREAFFVVRFKVWLGLGRLALGGVGEVTFAFEAAGGEARKGVEHTQEIKRVNFDGLAEGIGADFSDGFTDESGGDFVGGLENVDSLLLFGEAEGQLETLAGFFEQADLIEMILVTAASPAF